MIRSYAPQGEGLVPTEALDPAAPWLDLSQPTDAERQEVAALAGLHLPSLADQQEIEHSSRLYMDGGAPVMTALLPVRVEGGGVETAPVTFILTRDRLITLRHRPHGAFRTFPELAARAALGLDTPLRLLVGLLEAVVDRLADFTEQTGRDIDALTRAAFHVDRPAKPRDHDAALRDVGRLDTVVMQLRESLLSIERLLGFLQSAQPDARADERRALKSAQRDVRTITEQASFLTQKTSLLLDATLGLIDIEQNNIARIFSIMATVFLPPTLIASVFGMNFVAMSILDWRWGHVAALALMVASAVLPLLWFRRKGWL